ncbi:two-component flavin-dependent monooxygenase [Actinacidiphila rubida]|uniref:Two-component flavin-dependent monooxygenase n=1 Tax=Actinacidiphila rubida TaxID=310780 RepID=A0A1H8KAX6_9ACTN|nr:oxidoreductase [Actinacidiphila rubida]SEN90113.1 two-component flavin-dependent monooxygenase [Actinacidiphila rubida]
MTRTTPTVPATAPTFTALAATPPSAAATAAFTTAPASRTAWPRAERLRAAGSTAARHAAAADRDPGLAPETVTAVTRAGFPAYFVPRGHGGHQGDFTSLLHAVAELAENCSSAGWCAALWATHGRYAALLPEEGRREVWTASPDTRIAAGLVPRGARAVRHGSHWSLSGRWECVSAVGNSAWVLLAATVDPGPARQPEPGTRAGMPPGRDGAPDAARVFAVPTAAVEVTATWDSSGLRGTGSDTVTLAPTVVPAHRSFDFADVASGARTAGAAADAVRFDAAGTSGEGTAGPRCHTAPALLVGGLVLCAPALGAARTALRSWTDWAAAKAPLTGSLSAALGRSSAEIEAAELLLTAAARRADADPVTALAVARNHRDAAVAVDLLVTAVERLIRSGGPHICDATSTVQRCWRDVHAIASHAVLRFEAAADLYARELLA